MCGARSCDITAGGSDVRCAPEGSLPAQSIGALSLLWPARARGRTAGLSAPAPVKDQSAKVDCAGAALRGDGKLSAAGGETAGVSLAHTSASEAGRAAA